VPKKRRKKRYKTPSNLKYGSKDTLSKLGVRYAKKLLKGTVYNMPREVEDDLFAVGLPIQGEFPLHEDRRHYIMEQYEDRFQKRFEEIMKKARKNHARAN